MVTVLQRYSKLDLNLHGYKKHGRSGKAKYDGGWASQTIGFCLAGMSIKTVLVGPEV